MVIYETIALIPPHTWKTQEINTEESLISKNDTNESNEEENSFMDYDEDIDYALGIKNFRKVLVNGFQKFIN